MCIEGKFAVGRIVSMLVIPFAGLIGFVDIATGREWSDANSSECRFSSFSENEKVEKLFEEMRKGEYADRGFPKLTFEDIPALLERCESGEILRRFPRNPLSSQFEKSCREGIIAIWLIEGIRKGGRYPSSAALCLTKGEREDDWTLASENNHEKLVVAYRKWWEIAAMLSEEEAMKLDPLVETGLAWH